MIYQRSLVGLLFYFLIIALGLTFVMLSFNNEITLLMNTPKEAIEATKSYLSICSAGIIFIVGYNVVSSILRGLGDSKTPLLFVFIEYCFNRIFSYGNKRGYHCDSISPRIFFSLCIMFIYSKKRKLVYSFIKKIICFSKYIQKDNANRFSFGITKCTC